MMLRILEPSKIEFLFLVVALRFLFVIVTFNGREAKLLDDKTSWPA